MYEFSSSFSCDGEDIKIDTQHSSFETPQPTMKMDEGKKSRILKINWWKSKHVILLFLSFPNESGRRKKKKKKWWNHSKLNCCRNRPPVNLTATNKKLSFHFASFYLRALCNELFFRFSLDSLFTTGIKNKIPWKFYQYGVEIGHRKWRRNIVFFYMCFQQQNCGRFSKKHCCYCVFWFERECVAGSETWEGL